jgi:hypothetical protein
MDMTNQEGSQGLTSPNVWLLHQVNACCSCPGTQFLQEAWWDMIIEHFNLDLYVEISQYDNEQRYQILLGKKPTTDINELDYEKLLKLCHCHLIYCITGYNFIVNSLSFRTSITWHISVFIYFYTILHRLKLQLFIYLFIRIFVKKIIISYNMPNCVPKYL